MSSIWIVFPPWLYAVLITWLGRLGQGQWMRRSNAAQDDRPAWSWSTDLSAILITNLVFLSLVPISLLSAIKLLLPFTGARAGLSLGIVAFLFGCVPPRLLDAPRVGWDRTLWAMLIDFLRVAGALLIVGWLVAS